MPEPKQILKVLREELALQTRHCSLLEAQEAALLACDRVRFSALQTEHSQMLLQLEAQANVRQAALMDQNGVALTLASLKEQTPAGSLPGLDKLEYGLRQTMDRVQHLSCRNKMLIENELDYLAFTLDLFVEAGRSADNRYGGSGRHAGRLLLDRRA